MRFALGLVGIFVAAFIVITVQRAAGAPYWAYYPLALIAAAGCWSAAFVLMRAHKRKYFEIGGGEQLIARFTGDPDAGVPAWVDYIGVAGTCFVLAIPFELVALAFR